MARVLVFLVIALSSEPSKGSDAATDAQDAADDGSGAPPDAVGEASPDTALAGDAVDATTSDAPAVEASPMATDAAADGMGAETCQVNACPVGSYCKATTVWDGNKWVTTGTCTIDCRIDADCGAHARCSSGYCIHCVDCCTFCRVGEETGPAPALALFVAAVAVALSRRRK